MATRKSDSIFTHLLRCIFVANLFLSVLSTGVPGPCSSLSSLEIKVDWWSILPYSTGEKQKDGNYTYTGKDLVLQMIMTSQLTIFMFSFFFVENSWGNIENFLCSAYDKTFDYTSMNSHSEIKSYFQRQKLI